MKKQAIIAIIFALFLCSTAQGAVKTTSGKREIPSELRNLMAKNKGKIVIYHTGSEPMTIDGKDHINEAALTITGPGVISVGLLNSTDTINVPGSGKKQYAVYNNKKDGSQFTFKYSSVKTKVKVTRSWKDVWNLKLGDTVFTPLTDSFNTNELNQYGTRDLSTIGMAYFRPTPGQSGDTNYLVIYDANGNYVISLNLEKGTPINQ